MNWFCFHLIEENKILTITDIVKTEKYPYATLYNEMLLNKQTQKFVL